jgi:hypothetical protein
MAKPSGISGFFREGMNAQGQVMGGFEQISFPQEKSEIGRRKWCQAQLIVHVSKKISVSEAAFFGKATGL